MTQVVELIISGEKEPTISLHDRKKWTIKNLDRFVDRPIWVVLFCDMVKLENITQLGGSYPLCSNCSSMLALCLHIIIWLPI